MKSSTEVPPTIPSELFLKRNKNTRGLHNLVIYPMKNGPPSFLLKQKRGIGLRVTLIYWLYFSLLLIKYSLIIIKIYCIMKLQNVPDAKGSKSPENKGREIKFVIRNAQFVIIMVNQTATFLKQFT